MSSQPPSPISFRSHEVRAGNIDGARADFHLMLVALIGVRSPHLRPRIVAANPGDWGIDVFVGDLDEAIDVWQSKYFPDKVTADHQQQIRNSFKRAREKAVEEGYTLETWTLCVPSSMDGPTTQWWDRWKKTQKRQHGVTIELWDESTLRTFLLTPDAQHVRREYYGDAASFPPIPLQEQGDDKAFDGALFVRQLLEAGHVETNSARAQFFNADYASREINDKALEEEKAALVAARYGVQSIWEERFNNAVTSGDADPKLPGLHLEVMNEIANRTSVLVGVLPLQDMHTKGLMHMSVDDGQAGWVKHYRDVADQHRLASQVDDAGPRDVGVGQP